MAAGIGPVPTGTNTSWLTISAGPYQLGRVCVRWENYIPWICVVNVLTTGLFSSELEVVTVVASNELGTELTVVGCSIML
jgi:hypothetical protein